MLLSVLCPCSQVHAMRWGHLLDGAVPSKPSASPKTPSSNPLPPSPPHMPQPDGWAGLLLRCMWPHSAVSHRLYQVCELSELHLEDRASECHDDHAFFLVV